MLGKMIAWFIEQKNYVAEAMDDSRNSREESELRKKANDLLRRKLRNIEQKQKRNETLDKIQEIEDADAYEYEEEDQTEHKDSSMDSLLGGILSNFLTKAVTQIPTISHTTPNNESFTLPKEAIALIKSCANPEQLKQIASKHFPNMDDSTAKTLFEAYH
jgi:hypothetical protein